MQRKLLLYFLIAGFALFFISSCGKGDKPAPNACSGVTITVDGTTTATTTTTAADGKITATATGGSGFTFSIDGSAFQSTGVFNSLAAGNHTVVAKSNAGCTGNKQFTVDAFNPCNGTPGPLFKEVKTLFESKCNSCHNATNTNGGKNWTVDCNIVTDKARIKARAVDNIPTPMPATGALPQSEKDIITAWLNAGGTITN